MFLPNIGRAQHRALIDSILKSKQPDTTKITALIDEAYTRALKADTATPLYAEAAIKKMGTYSTPAYNMRRAQINNVVGIYNMFTGNFDKAQASYSKNLLLGKQMKDDFVVAKAYLNLGGLANNQSNYNKALTYLFKALRYSEHCNDPGFRPSVLGDIANTYIRLKQYKKAIEILNEALPVVVRIKDVRVEANICNSLAIAYDAINMMGPALKAQLRSYNIYKKTENTKGIATSALNLGSIYTEMKRYTLAEKYIRESITNARPAHDNENLGSAFQYLAENERLSGKLPVALKYVDSAIQYNSLVQNRHIMADLYQLKAKILAKSGNYKLGYEFLNRNRSLTDSILSTDINEKVAEMEAKYETEKKQRENEKLIYDNKLQTLAKNKAVRDKTIILFCAVAGIILLTLIFISVYRNRHIKYKFKQEQIANKALFEGEQKERIRIARDLHDSIGQMLSVIKMNLSNTDNQNRAHNLAATATLVDKTINEVRHISHNLIPEELNFGLFAALEDMADKISNTGTTKVQVNINDDARAHRFEKSNELSVYRIVQEALSNIVKHAGAKVVELNIDLTGRVMLISVKDDGKGFDTGQIKNSTGIGWKNIAARVNLLNGNLAVWSEKLKGTQIEISIPA